MSGLAAAPAALSRCTPIYSFALRPPFYIFAQGVKEGDCVVSARFQAARRQNSAVWSGTRRLQLNHQIITDIQRTEHINTNARHVFPWACATLSVSATPAIIRRCRSNSGVPGRNSRFCLQAVLRLIGSEVYGDIVYMVTDLPSVIFTDRITL